MEIDLDSSSSSATSTRTLMLLQLGIGAAVDGLKQEQAAGQATNGTATGGS